MARRPKRVRKPRPPRQAKGTYRAAVAGGGDLGEAANVIADEARRLAGWSQQIAGDINVESSGDGRTATVWTDAGPAYPAETGARHPLFAQGERGMPGSRGWGHWYTPAAQQKPFLGPAADAKASDAMDRYAQKFERLLKKAGFE
jgi:hypothetical protein